MIDWQNPPKTALPEQFYFQNTVEVARQLLGQLLCCNIALHDEAPQWAICRIVETEAYTQDDPACHAYQKNKGRAATLYKAPGLAYVYFIYGMYYCLNAVTETEGQAGAVLIRALEPLHAPPHIVLNTKGPGRLCKALSISKAHNNELPLTDANQNLFIAPGEKISDANVITCTRIGINQAQDYPWRFYIRDNKWVSVKAKIF